MKVAAYARYSSDQQREASLEDQLRNCRAYCARQGWNDPVVYTDAAVSGSRSDRPGYRRLLADAAKFDAILVDDLSRLSRDSIESATAIKRLRFAGVRVIGVSDGLDTGRKGHKADVGLRGLMSELYLDDLADKTHRGLTGRALGGASAGGLPYGYVVTLTGGRAIEPDQAAVVRRIFAEYLDGQSPRAIAAGLNHDRIPSPRGGTWAASAIYGNRRGVGILANPIYVGRQVWNRSRWVKHPDTGRRVRQERDAGEWISTEHPELAIVDASTWAATERRRVSLSIASGGAGRPQKHLLSGLLRCGDCGGPMVAVDRYRYGCATAKERGTCPSKVRVARTVAEDALLAGVREQLGTEAAFQRFQRAAAAELRRRAPDKEAVKRKLETATRERDNLMAALKAGIITPTVRAELSAAERQIAEAESELAASRSAPAALLPRARETWTRMIAQLTDYGRNVPAARAALRSLVGEATVKTENGALVAEIAPCQIKMVAGAGFVPYLTQAFRIQLGRA